MAHTLHQEDALYKLRFVLVGGLIFACLLLLIILVVGVGAGTVRALSSNSTGSSEVYVGSDSSNAVLGGVTAAADNLSQTMDRTGRSISYTTRTTAMTVVHGFGTVAHGAGTGIWFGVRSVGVGTWFAVKSVGMGAALAGRAVVTSVVFVGSSVGHGTMFIFRTVASGVIAVGHVPGKLIGLVTHAPTVSSIIKPVDHTPVPTIDANSPAVFAATKALATADTTTAHPVAVKPQWPIHGAVTTLFGVPELPFQAIHTGLDISDGNAPGITPIHPFRPGKVIEVVYSSLGLGNHVVIDHGSGVTSVYGHLNSISVHKGQKVTEKTIVGYEGTTGASTGPHLHFEIRVHGQATDPHKFIPGQP